MRNNIEVEIVIKDNSGLNESDYTFLFDNKNNISNENALSTRTDGQNPFLLGVSKLGDGSKLYDEYDGIISYALSDDDGNVDYNINIYIENPQIHRIAYGFYFDPLLDEYPTELVIDNKTVYNDNSFIYINEYINPTSNDEGYLFNISIKKWNKPNRPIIINAILKNIVSLFNSSSIKNMSLGTQIESDNTVPNFGLVGKYGSLTLIDKNETLNDYLEDGLLKGNNPIVSVKYNNHYVARYFSRNWQQDEKSKTFSLDLYDRVENFERIIVPKITYKPNKSAFDIFLYLFNYTNLSKYKMSNTIKTELEKIIVDEFYTTEDKNLFALFNDFCNLTMTSLFINENNELEIVKYV